MATDKPAMHEDTIHTVPVDDTVVRIIAEHFGQDVAALPKDSQLADTLGADSFDVVQLAFAFEETFHIDLQNVDLSRVKTVSDCIAIVTERSYAPTQDLPAIAPMVKT